MAQFNKTWQVLVRAVTFLGFTLALSNYIQASPALLKAAEQGDMAEVQLLLDAGADINFTAPNDTPKWAYRVSTALEIAAAKGHTDVVALLLQRDAKTRDDQWYGLYAATWAGRNGHTESILLLLRHQNPEAERLNALFGPALITATRSQQLATIPVLLAEGIDPDWHTPGDAFPKPAILVAAAPGHEEAFLLLLDAGADPTPYPDILGYTSTRADPEMVQRLLDLGMDPNDEGDYGHPLALTACSSVAPTPEHKEQMNATIRVLLAAGSEVNVPVRGRSALHCARETHNEALVALLDEHGAEEFETMARKLKRAGWQAIFTFGNH